MKYSEFPDCLSKSERKVFVVRKVLYGEVLHSKRS